MKNKYLKYHPYITREVFGDIINSLKNNYKVDFNLDEAYKLFSTKVNYLIVNPHDSSKLNFAYNFLSDLKPASWIKILGKEYVLKLANEHYPYGTKYRRVKYHSSCQVKGVLLCYLTEDCITDGCGGSVYLKGVWANKIEDTPKIIIEDGKFIEFEEQNSSDSEFKLYDWVMINESELPITDNWLGEGDSITHQGAYQITEIKNNHVIRLGNIKCTLGFPRFRLATQDEINTAIRLSKHEHYVNKLKQASNMVINHQASNMLLNKLKEDNYIFGANEDFKINIDSFDNPNQIHVPKKATIKVEVNQEVKINIPVKSKIKI